MITTAQAIAKYGKPNETGKGYLITIDLPFPMIVSWDKGVRVKRIQCHKLIADRLKKALQEILDHYGLAEIERLHINMYGGCFNFRKMRGGSDWSRHSWAIALDLDPERNLLKETAKTARFARPEYKPMIKIFYNNGFVNLGVEKGYDFMHFESKD